MRWKYTFPLFISLCMAMQVDSAIYTNPNDPYYVGEQACRECHHDMGTRNQFNPWRLSKHAKAYAALALPESKEIAKYSGVDVDPYESPICLGCHTTASQTEPWERNDTFHLEDGVQCELCHGPGSEYMFEHIMIDKEKSMMAGLKMPKESDCLVCHKEKGSHTAVLDVKPFVYEEALKEIAHNGREGDIISPPKLEGAPVDGPKYVGSFVCGECHSGEENGYQYSKWRMSKHSEAFAVLGTERAREIAEEQGIPIDPQESPKCLKCHTTGYGEPYGKFTESFDRAQGVHCESCHGPGSEYIPEETMSDPIAAHKAGLQKVNKETCLQCHPAEVHGKPFDFDAMWAQFDHSFPQEEPIVEIEYKTPFNIAITKDGKRLFVACEASDSLIVVNAKTDEIITEIEIENQPHDVSFSPDEKWAYVSNRGSDSVFVIDTETYEIVDRLIVGDEPHELRTDATGQFLYVANCGSYDISVIDLELGKEVKRLSAARGTWGMDRSDDGNWIYVSNNLSHFVAFRTTSVSEVTIIDAEKGIVANRVMIPDTNMVQGIDVSPDGEFAIFTMIRTKNLIPMTRVIQGWVLNNGIGIIWKNGRVDQLLLDEVNAYFADPADVVLSPDGKFAYVTGGGIDVVAVVDIEKVKTLLKNSTEQERKEILPNHLGISVEYVVKRIPVGRSPRGMEISPDGKYLYVADGLDDTISVIDTAKQERVKVISLGGPEEITLERKGERIFHNAQVTYCQQFSCHSCHPDGGIDGITYDIEPDGIGVNPVDNRTLRGILDTAPFKWTGKNPSLSRQCGARLAVFFTRIDPFTPEQIEALDRYICTIPRPPNRYRVGEELTPAQLRGRQVFERTRTNSGDIIPVENRCTTCHPAPYFTNRELADVGTGSYLDTDATFDVPHLNNIYETAPYLHDGRSDTLEEIWTIFNPYDEHGVTNDMTKDQLNDLIEYLKTL